MRAFYSTWPEQKILQTSSGESVNPGVFSDISSLPSTISVLATRFPLPWYAYVRLLSVKAPDARAFYETEALRSGWSIRQLDRQIGSRFYERIALSKNKAAMLEGAGSAEPSDAITAEETVKDPFVLEFLGLRDEYSESDLEAALIHNLTDFLLELGDDFAFLGRQKRLRLDDTWFRIDLLFFHRRLRCLVVIDLKVGKFSYADAGQMHLYLNYAREHWMKAGENPPVGLILCAEKERRKPTMLSITCRTKCLPPSIKPCSRTRSSLPKNWNDHAHSLKNGVQGCIKNIDFPFCLAPVLSVRTR
jgi:predicted nuclease of restriction endonuclease-like (RecB) superfamily